VSIDEPKLPEPPTQPFRDLSQPVSNDAFADNAEVRRVLVDCLHRLGTGGLAPSLQKRILKVLHPNLKIPKRRY
jgi:hypothetical protein